MCLERAMFGPAEDSSGQLQLFPIDNVALRFRGR